MPLFIIYASRSLCVIMSLSLHTTLVINQEGRWFTLLLGNIDCAEMQQWTAALKLGERERGEQIRAYMRKEHRTVE